jgi:integration host factor subunit alpha
MELVEQLLSIAKATMATGENLLLSGFGKFTIRDKKSRRGRNPQTGEKLQLGPRRVVTFKQSSNLRQRVNQG